MKMWFDNVNKRDARLLTRWWNGHTTGYFFVRKSGRFWAVVRQ